MDSILWLLVSVFSSVITVIIATLNAGSLTFDWKAIGLTALSTGAAYILKNFLTPSQIVVKDASPAAVEAVKEGEAKVTVERV